MSYCILCGREAGGGEEDDFLLGKFLLCPDCGEALFTKVEDDIRSVYEEQRLEYLDNLEQQYAYRPSSSTPEERELEQQLEQAREDDIEQEIQDIAWRTLESGDIGKFEESLRVKGLGMYCPKCGARCIAHYQSEWSCTTCKGKYHIP